MHVHSTTNIRDFWEPCPSGELRRMVGRIKTCQRRQFLQKLGGLAAGVAAVGAGGYAAAWWLSPSEDQPYGGITCTEVMAIMPLYHAGRLDPDLANKVTIHLAKCSHCAWTYRRKYGQLTA